MIPQGHDRGPVADHAGERSPAAGVHLARLVEDDDVVGAEPEAVVLDPPGERIEGERFGSWPQVGGKPLRLSTTYGDGKDPAGDILWRCVVA